jgi:xylose dehydrogenase (NAD/NADP)
MLRWGILGAARINRRLVPAFKASRRSHLEAVASRDLTRATAHAGEHGIARAVHGYERLLDDPSIDAVYIPLPNSEHVRWTLAAIDAGKHVLCEKPIALDPADVDRIAAAAAAAKVVVEEGFMYRHEPLTTRVIGLLADGAVGQIQTVTSGFTFTVESETNIRLDPALGGGALWDVGCYPVTYAQLIAGTGPVAVAGTARWHASGVDEEFEGHLRFDNGMAACIHAGFRAAYRIWLEVAGTDGRLTVPNPFRPSPMEALELTRDGEVQRIEVPGSPAIFEREVADFEASVLDGVPTVVSLAESRRTIATLTALYASARDAAPMYTQ